MSQLEIEQAVWEAVQALPGFDEGERTWIRTMTVAFLADAPIDPCERHIPDLVQQWACVLAAREQPVLPDEADTAIDAAVRMHGNLSQEEASFCRHLIYKWESTGHSELETVGDIADFILFAVLVLQDGSTDLSMLHKIADHRVRRVRSALACNGCPEPTPEEHRWLHQEVLADFAKPEFSPFEEDRAGRNRHIALLVRRLQSRRANVPI